ncbi:MAG: winged helix-turn-helix domain-containing protein [Nitrososphaerales archaeon]
MRIANDDVSQFLTKVVPFVNGDGARNLNRVSKELSIPYQTLRFRMLRLKDQGVSILPVINAERLGLERIRVLFDLAKDIADPASFFGGLHQTAGLHYYSRAMVSQRFDCEFMIPLGHRAELSRLLGALEEIEIIQNTVMRTLEWKEVLMMKTQSYDYEQEEWDVDFSHLSSDPSLKIPNPMPSEDFDHTDLMIIKSLQTDPWAKVVDLAKKLNMTEGDISYHLNRHVFGKRQVPSFRFKWVGTSEAWAKHSVLGMTLIFKEISDESARHAMSIVTALPFTWNHMRAADGTYITELLVPTKHLPESLQYLSDNLRGMDLLPDILYPDWSGTSNYTVPYLIHDDQAGWRFKAEESLGYILHMMQAYQKG